MCQRTGSALVQVMACRSFGAKPLPEPMLKYCQLDPWKHTSVKFESKYKTSIHENVSELSSAKLRPFLSRGNELSNEAMVHVAFLHHSYSFCMGLQCHPTLKGNIYVLVNVKRKLPYFPQKHRRHGPFHLHMQFCIWYNVRFVFRHLVLVWGRTEYCSTDVWADNKIWFIENFQRLKNECRQCQMLQRIWGTCI